MLGGAGGRLTPDVAEDAALTFVDARPWPNGVVELTYALHHP
jgi:hypothetical protein